MTESKNDPGARFLRLDLADVDRRLIELEVVLGPLLQERDALRAAKHLASIPRYGGAGGGGAAAWPIDPSEGAGSCVAPPGRRHVRAHTHRTMVMTTLAKAGRPMGVRELVDGIREDFGEEIPRTSVSPLLRKLARRGEVVHDAAGAKWSADARPAGATDDERPDNVVEVNMRKELGRSAA